MACIRNIKSLTKAFKKGALLSILNILEMFLSQRQPNQLKNSKI